MALGYFGSHAGGTLAGVCRFFRRRREAGRASQQFNVFGRGCQVLDNKALERTFLTLPREF
jgi:hypothetical protein